MNDIEKGTIKDWIINLRQPSQDKGDGKAPVLVLLHGLSGDEDVMWIFAQKLGGAFLTIAPRAPHVSSLGGFSWYPEQAELPPIDEFLPAAEQLHGLLNEQNFPGGDFDQIYLMGFSQGAAMAYTYSLLYPQRVRAVAGLAGFMPQGVEKYASQPRLADKRAFVAHGSQDEQVSVERGREAVAFLEKAGAQVTYCEDEVGHKLSAACFRALQGFFLSEIP